MSTSILIRLPVVKSPLAMLNDEVGFKYVAEKDMRIEFSTDYVSATTEPRG